MIKGVNKQIIEINYTKNDYVQKAILFINPKKAFEPKEIVDEKAYEYINTIVSHQSPKKRRFKKQAIVIGINVLVLILLIAGIIISTSL